MIRLMFVHYTLNYVWVSEWPLLINSCPLDGHLFSLYFGLFVFFNHYHFGFKSEMWLLIAPVPVHCFSSTYIIHTCSL